MKILFILSKFSKDPTDSTLVKDLVSETKKQGHDCFVATILERKFKKPMNLSKYDGINVLEVKTGNMFNNVTFIEKGITSFTLPLLFKKAILNYWRDENFDLIVTHTPFMASSYLISSMKKYFKAKSFLILWDLFPQNAKDLGLIKNPLLYSFFKRKELKTYQEFDYIGCMSPGNLKFMEQNYPSYLKEKFILLRNWASEKIKRSLSYEKKINIRNRYHLNTEDFLCVFGGNLGKPQKLENILQLAESVQDQKDIQFLFVGNGTEKNYLKQIATERKLKSVRFFDYIPRDDYEDFIASCDVGLVSLHEKFTVPNYPSKTTDYLKIGLPILASLDATAIKDYGYELENVLKAGLCSIAGNTERLKENLLKLYNNKELRESCTINGQKFYQQELSTKNAVNSIIKTVEN